MLTEIPRAEPPEATADEDSRWSVAGPRDLAPVRDAIATLTRARHRLAPLLGPILDTSGAAGSPGQTPLLASVSERLVIVFSELATNALRHGAPPVAATVRRSRHGWVVIVEDSAHDDAPVPREPGADGGHGLRLVARLSRSIGWDRHGAHKLIWAEVGDDPPHELLQQLAGVSGGLTATH